MAVDPARAKTLFLNASDLADLAERAAYLDRECGGDAELRGRVEALLKAHGEPESDRDRSRSQFEATLIAGAAQGGLDEAGDHCAEPADSQTSKPPEPNPTAEYVPQVEPSLVIAGRYTLQEKIGEGGMGEVWVAKQTEPVKRKVALKLIKTGMDSKAVLSRFEQERQALAMMDHPNIARVLDGGITPTGQPFFVMELVNGLPLNKFCDEMKLTPKERLELFVPICQAVQHAHQKGIVHRDLKPANILITMIDGKPVPKVIDFGVAKATAGKLTDESMSTQFGAVLGTLEYMSPEQAGFAGEDVDTRADIYSLGVILYESLTGLRPIDAKRLKKAAITEMIRIIREEEPSKPSTRLSTDESLPSLAALRQTMPKRLTALLRGELDWVVMKCLEKDRTRRYETANGLARDIQRYLSDEVVEARPPTAAYRIQKFVRRNRSAVVGMISAVVILPSMLSLAAITMASRSERNRANEERAKAVAAREVADDARELESQAKAEALKQRDMASEQEKRSQVMKARAEEAEIQAKQAEYEAIAARNAAEVAKIQEEYEAYVGRIGLASAKIDENAFGGARELLAGCKPALRNWEWGRLMYLCGLSVRSVDAQAPLDAVAFSSDGSKFATGGWSRTVQVWDTTTGKLLLAIPCNGQNLYSVAFSPGGRYLAAGGNDPTAYIRLWDAATGQPVTTPSGFGGHKDFVHSVAFSRDGKKLLTASYDRTARLWDVATGAEIRPFIGHSWWVLSAVFSPDERQIVTASHDGSAIIWDAESGERRGQFCGHKGPVFSAAFSPDGLRVATGGHDRRVLLWRPADMRQFDPERAAQGAEADPARFQALEGHGGPVRSVSFSADGKMIVSASRDNTIKVWDPQTGLVLKTLRGHDGWVEACAVAPDNRTLVSASRDHFAALWDLSEYEEVRVLQGLSPRGEQVGLRSAAFDQGGRTLVTTGRDGSARIWDSATGVELRVFRESDKSVGTEGQIASQDGIAAAGFSPDTRFLVTCGGEASIHLRDARTGKALRTLDGHRARVNSVVYSPDGSTILSASDDGTAILWDAIQGTIIRVFVGHHDRLSSAVYSPDKKLILTASYDKTARLWNAETGAEVGRFDGHAWAVLCAVFSLDGTKVVTGSQDNAAMIWDVASRKVLTSLIGHTAAVTSVTFLPDPRRPEGTRVLTGSEDTTAKLWDSRTGKEIVTLKGHSQGVTCVVVPPDGRSVLTTSLDGTARIWMSVPW